MQEIIAFAVNNPLLCAAFIVVLFALIGIEIFQKFLGPKAISPSELSNLVNHSQAVVIDIRDAKSFSHGHITGAKHLEVDVVATSHPFIKKQLDKPLILIDANGIKSPSVAAKLKGQGATHVMLLKGGVEAWQADNLPLVKKSS